MTIPIKFREPKVELKPKTLIMDKQHTIMDVSIFEYKICQISKVG